MSLINKWLYAVLALGALVSSGMGRPARIGKGTPEAHRVTLVDVITMTRIAGSRYTAAHPKSDIAAFSPDGRYFTLVIAKGDLQHNVNSYSLLLFHSKERRRREIPRKLVTFPSSSNRPGIFEVTWLHDNDTILFLGSRGSEPTELYSVRRRSGRLTKVTSHRTSLLSYGMAEHADEFVYAAEAPDKNLLDEETLRHGFEVTSERVEDLVRGHISTFVPELFLKRTGRAERRLRTQYPFDSGVNDLSLSPDGRYLVLKTDAVDPPGQWAQYDDPNIQTAFRSKAGAGHSTRILHYEIMDVRTGRSDVLLNAPATYAPSDVLWSPDSKSLLLCGTYLPLNGTNPSQFESRRMKRFVVEIDVATRRITEITSEDLRPVYWDPRTNIVQFSALASPGQAGVPQGVAFYQKAGGLWSRLAATPELAADLPPEILVDEDLNRPPRIMELDPRTGRRTVRMDLNPQFAHLIFGREKEIHWAAADGSDLIAGLYLPPDYEPGKRYPLVIQTHGFDSQEFWLDGSHTTAFAAQPLANKGIAVLQLNDIFVDTMDTPQEMSHVLDVYESAIDYLDEAGIIDPNRVGLIGFSRTCMYVKYALARSRHHFAAALVADGVDAGYFQYLLYFNSEPRMASEFESVIGGAPFSDGMQLWLRNSPGFLLDRVQTPILIQAIGPESVLGEWQWFDGLRRLGKPVEMLYLPVGTHVLVKPWDRMASQGTAVDWFAFWLNGDEQSDPSKVEEYARWRKLRSLTLSPAPP